MSWNLSLTECAGKRVECVITPDPNDPNCLEYQFVAEHPNIGVNPFVSTLQVHRVAGHNNGGSFSIMSVLETCPASGSCENSDYCNYKVVDVSQARNPSEKTNKQTTIKVSGQL